MSTEKRKMDNGKDIDIVMPVYTLIEYSDGYSKTSGSLQKFYRDESLIDDNGAIANFHSDNDNSASFKFQTKIASRIRNDGRKMLKLEYLQNT